MYQVILMDLDNTILDFDSAERFSFQKVVEHVGLEYGEGLILDYQRINKLLWHELEQGKISKSEIFNTRFLEFFKLHGHHVDNQEVEKIFREHLDNSAELIQGAKHTLEELRRRGKRVYSASNGVYSTQISRMTKSGILDLFDGHFISEKIQHEKPAIGFFDYCVKHLEEVARKDILMVGDTPLSDIQGALNSGIDACFYRHNKNLVCKEAKYTIDDITHLLEIVL